MYTNKCMEIKFWYIHKMDHYSATEMNKLWIHAIAEINHKIMMQSESQNTIQSTYSVILYM